MFAASPSDGSPVVPHEANSRSSQCRQSASKWDLRSSGILRSLEWHFLADFSGQPIDPICKGQEASIGCSKLSVWNYHFAQWNPPEEFRLSLHRGGNLESRNQNWLVINVDLL
jgi:hypothetical protein